MFILAFVIACFAGIQEARRQGMDTRMIFKFVLIIFLSGTVFARLFYVLENLGSYLRNPIEIFLLWHGGLSWYGGIAGGIACGSIYIKIKKAGVYKAWDLVVPFVALAQAIGRIGCLLNGCCYGKEATSGIILPPLNIITAPVQVYSVLALLSIFIILLTRYRRPHKAGEIAYLYLVLYSLKRFIIEFWRADNEIMFAGLSSTQV